MVFGLKTIRKNMEVNRKLYNKQREKEMIKHKIELEKQKIKAKKKAKEREVRDKKETKEREVRDKKRKLERKKENVFKVKLHSVGDSTLLICSGVNYVTALEQYNKIKEQIQDPTIKTIEYEHDGGFLCCIMKEHYKSYMLTINDW